MKKKKVLLVDDVRLFLKLEETFFKRAGCEILTAECGERAVAQAQSHQPDLILLDYIMPDLMGDEVCRRLKADERTRDIPVIMVSTSSDAADLEKCFAAGATEYVTKPINAQDLLAKAAALLDIPQRVHFRVPVLFRVVGRAGGKSFSGLSRNLSLGGMLLECQECVSPQDRLSLDLPILPGQATLSFQGVVVRVDKDLSTDANLVGLHFVELTSEHQKALDHFLREQKNKLSET